MRCWREAAQGEVVSAANLNSPDQIVIAGHAGAVARAMDLAKAAGAQRAIPLPVSAPFHCPLMKPGAGAAAVDLDATDFADLACPLVNNWQAREIRTGAEAREGLYQQVPNPVRWVETIRYLAAAGSRRGPWKWARAACSPGCCAASSPESPGSSSASQSTLKSSEAANT